MAKSARSQRVRKMKAIRKNTYYKAKEMEQLKKMVENTKKRELEQMAKVVTAETLTSNVSSLEGVAEGGVATNTVVGAKKKKYDKNMRDENGQYPIWLHQRKIKKIEGQMFHKKMKLRLASKRRKMALRRANSY